MQCAVQCSADQCGLAPSARMVGRTAAQWSGIRPLMSCCKSAQKLASGRLSKLLAALLANVTHLVHDLARVSDHQQQCDRLNHSVPLQPATQGIRVSCSLNDRLGARSSSLSRGYKLHYMLPYAEQVADLELVRPCLSPGMTCCMLKLCMLRACALQTDRRRRARHATSAWPRCQARPRLCHGCATVQCVACTLHAPRHGGAEVASWRLPRLLSRRTMSQSVLLGCSASTVAP